MEHQASLQHGSTEKARSRSRGEPHSTEAARPGPSFLPAVNLLALQHSAGNAAVSRLVAGARPTAKRSGSVQRFVGPEHEQLGNVTGTSIDLGNGVVLTWGQVVAIAGDEFGSVEDLQAAVATDEGKARLRAALEHDGVPGATAAKLPQPKDDKERKAQDSDEQKKFVDLAMHNTAHFPDAGEAIDAWANHHAAALEEAVKAGLANNPGGMQLAYLNEAFGEHFLTDCFSGGHIRTPRHQIVDWYVGTFAPRVTAPLVAALKTRLVEALVREASPQTNWPDWIVRGKIKDKVEPGIDSAINGQLGGMAKLTEWVGLGIAGAISGAIHDSEGEQGVRVSSDDHPEPWIAYGDKGLDKSPVSREQATKAIAAAKKDVDTAYLVGEREGALHSQLPASPPAHVYFAFNSSALSGEAKAAAAAAAAYLIYRPDAAVDLIGHTDPIVTDAVNDALGQQRADAVAAAL